ncbi:uncharacterized protein LOC135121899 isoform X2 [Zophobas morio]|uniref:uncharacterized protein LOC135121899 isoform X2 n=1 Tax=Zophobas morio TaxID=2755281 RepID=UPI00308286A9
MVSKPRWPDNSRIFLGNLVPQVQDSVIRAIFSKYGPIAEIVLHENFGFVQFENPTTATLAIEKERNLTIEGREVVVRLSSNLADRKKNALRGRRGRGGLYLRESAIDYDGYHDLHPGSSFGYHGKFKEFEREPFRGRGGRERVRERGRRRNRSVERFERRPRSRSYNRYSPSRRSRSRSRSFSRSSRARSLSRSFSRSRSRSISSADYSVAECQIIYYKEQTGYVNYLASIIEKNGLSVGKICLSPQESIPHHINRLIARRIPFVCVVNSHDEKNSRTSLSLLLRKPVRDLLHITITEAIEILTYEMRFIRKVEPAPPAPPPLLGDNPNADPEISALKDINTNLKRILAQATSGHPSDIPPSFPALPQEQHPGMANPAPFIPAHTPLAPPTFASTPVGPPVQALPQLKPTYPSQMTPFGYGQLSGPVSAPHMQGQPSGPMYSASLMNSTGVRPSFQPPASQPYSFQPASSSHLAGMAHGRPLAQPVNGVDMANAQPINSFQSTAYSTSANPPVKTETHGPVDENKLSRLKELLNFYRSSKPEIFEGAH